jgi:hypothetical protein
MLVVSHFFQAGILPEGNDCGHLWGKKKPQAQTCGGDFRDEPGSV